MFNFQQEIEDQLREIREQYGDEVLKEYLDQDYYDGESVSYTHLTLPTKRIV